MKIASGNRSPRRGVTAVVVLLLLSLLAVVAGALLRMSLIQEQRELADEQRAQADWLVEAGAERAWARLSGDPGYKGETWEIDAESLGGDSGKVVIEVGAGEGEEAARTVRVEAEYPSGVARSVRSSKSFSMRAPGAPRDQGERS